MSFLFGEPLAENTNPEDKTKKKSTKEPKVKLIEDKQEAMKVLENTISDETFEEDFPATPMVYLVGKGEVKDVNEGYTEYDTYVKFLEDNGVEKK